MKIVFLLPSVSDSHCLKRVEALEFQSINVRVLGFKREYFPRKKWHGNIKVLGDIDHGSYYKRIFVFLKAFAVVVSEIKSADVIYAFGQDLLGFGWVASLFITHKLKIVCEVADIQPALTGNNTYSKGLRLLERFLIQKVDILVVTSYAFISEYYNKIQGLTTIPYKVIENKVVSNHIQTSYIKNEEFAGNSILRIGYFGLLRCNLSLEILNLVAVRGFGRIKIYLRGPLLFNKDIEKVLIDNSNIEYGGPFISPDELPEMYSRINMVWNSYYGGPEIGNWCWVRSNRFYEACFFGKPMLCQIGTEDSRIVESLDIGLSADMTKQEDYVDKILKINISQLKTWKNNIKNLPIKMHTYTDEHTTLVKTLFH